MKIAFFDSGVGGLSVLHHAMKVLPHEQFVFFADEDNVPYGTKSKQQVRDFVAEAFDFLMTKDVKAIVTACNTATSVAVAEMRRRYDIPIIGMEPAAKKALDMDGEHRVLVTATPITVKGRKMELLIEKVDKDRLVDRLALPELVTSAVAAKKNEVDMALGNVIGSNIFNILMVLGISGAISPMTFTTENAVDLAVLIGFSALVWLFCIFKQRLERWQGGVMLALYAGYVVYACMR